MHFFMSFSLKCICSLCRTSENYVLYYYVKPYTRYGPFLIGVLTGIYLTTKKNPLLKQWVRIFLTGISARESLSLWKHLKIVIVMPFGLQPSQNLKICHHTYVLVVSAVPVAGGTRLVLVPVTFGCVGWTGLHPEGDTSQSIHATRLVSGAAQTPLGTGCDLDHTGLWGGLWR